MQANWRSFTRAAGLALLLLGLGTAAEARPDDAEPAARTITRATPARNFAAARQDMATRAVKAALARRYDEARALALKSRDPVAVKLVEWLYLRGNPKDARAPELMAFADANPKWPLVRTFRVRAERRLMLSRDAELIRRHFARHKPLSAYGRLALAWLRDLRGDRVGAARLVRQAWLDTGLTPEAERFAIRNLRRHVSRALDEQRLWRLIVAQQTVAALRTAGRLSRQHQAAARAARALIRFRRNGPALYRRLPAAMRNQPAMRYAMARYYRKRGPWERALTMLEKAPPHSRQLDPAQWFVEKRLVARYMLADHHRRHWRRLYRLMARHGFTRPGKPAYRGEFLAGFIAMEKLNDPRTALKHFRRMPGFARTRTSKAKAWYWVGRAREALGDIEGARRAYRESARTPTVFYGLLSREKLGLGRRPIPLKTARPTAESRRRVAAHELGRAVSLLAAAGGNDLAGHFVWPLAYAFNRREDLAAAASLLWDVGGPGMAVRLAKAAGMRGIDIDNYGYPVRALPRFRHLGPPLEDAALYGLIRQESEFQATAGSHAGARGLMQLMPATARREARLLRVPYRTSWLTSRPSYNLMLGRHHLARLIQGYNGSYILGFAAYNAGGGNVRKWLQAYGDFRSGRPDPLEWIEQIPITETRLYVQKVLQGTHVYRTRLGRRMLPMSYDLWRGVPGWREQVLPPPQASPKSRPAAAAAKKDAALKPPAATTPSSAATHRNCAHGADSITDLIGRC